MSENNSIVRDNFSASQVETKSILRVILALPSPPQYPQDVPEGKVVPERTQEGLDCFPEQKVELCCMRSGEDAVAEERASDDDMYVKKEVMQADIEDEDVAIVGCAPH